jgi:RNA-binding protein
MRQRGAITHPVATRKPASKTNKAKSKPEPLTGKARRHMRALGHSLDVVLHVGKAGISDALLEELDQVLTAHELVKVRILRECPLERDKAAEQLASRSGAEHVQSVGNVLLIYRKGPEKPAVEKPEVGKVAAKAIPSSKAKRQIHHRAKAGTGERARKFRSAEGEKKAQRAQPRKPTGARAQASRHTRAGRG